MTRRHFRAIAEVIKGLSVRSEDSVFIKELCLSFADMCSEFNPNFNRKRFLEACGYYD